MLNPHLISRLRKIDWDFAGSLSDSPFSNIHWYPARFASQLPATLIGLLSKPGDVVLDPFMGSGTTLVEAQRLCRSAIGIDLNPIASLLTKAKTLSLTSARISGICARLKDRCISALTHLSDREVQLPCNVQTKWYTHSVRRDLGHLWEFIQLEVGYKKLLAQAAFSAILLPVCRETRHWGYVCDNSTPVGNHSDDVLQRYCDVLDRFDRAYQERDVDIEARLGKKRRAEQVQVIRGDSRLELEKLGPRSVDLILTSPPYFGVSDYTKSQRLSMEWFGYEIEPLRKVEIGARSKRHRQRAVDEYTSELAEVFSAARCCLKEDAACAVIIGESTTRESVLDFVVQGLRSAGFHMHLNQNRRVSSQRRQTPSITGEHLLVLSK